MVKRTDGVGNGDFGGLETRWMRVYLCEQVSENLRCNVSPFLERPHLSSRNRQYLHDAAAQGNIARN